MSDDPTPLHPTGPEILAHLGAGGALIAKIDGEWVPATVQTTLRASFAVGPVSGVRLVKR